MTRIIHDRLFVDVMGEAADGVVVSDRRGDIVYWNLGASRIFGFSADEVIGKNLELIIPERFRARHREGYRKAMETGITKYSGAVLSVPALTKSGDTISIEFSVVLLKDDEGFPVGICAIVRDVSERYFREKELRRRLKALEEEMKKLSS